MRFWECVLVLCKASWLSRYLLCSVWRGTECACLARFGAAAPWAVPAQVCAICKTLVVSAWAQVRKLDDTEFRNPFERAYIRVYDDSDSSRIRARDRLRSRSRCARNPNLNSIRGVGASHGVVCK